MPYGDGYPNGVGQRIIRIIAVQNTNAYNTIGLAKCRTSLRFQYMVSQRSQGAPSTATLGYVVKPLRGDPAYVSYLHPFWPSKWFYSRDQFC